MRGILGQMDAGSKFLPAPNAGRMTQIRREPRGNEVAGPLWGCRMGFLVPAAPGRTRFHRFHVSDRRQLCRLPYLAASTLAIRLAATHSPKRTGTAFPISLPIVLYFGTSPSLMKRYESGKV